MILHSIKWRLQAWHAFLLVCLVAGLMTGFYSFERQARLQGIDEELQQTIAPLLPRFGPPVLRGFGEPGPPERPPRSFRPGEAGPPGPPPQSRFREEFDFHSEKIYLLAWNRDGVLIAASTNAPGNMHRPPFAGANGGRRLRTLNGNRELIHGMPNGNCVLLGTSLAPALAQLHQLALGLVLIGAAIVVTGLAVGWRLANRALRPIAEISHAAQEIAAGDLAKRINSSETESELGQLATVLNSTFARLETAFGQQRQFTSDAAHELRTPVSVILTQTQSTLNRERSGPEYRETLEACQRAAQRMRRLIESLLQLARLDAGQEALKREDFDLAGTAGDSVELIRPLAERRQIKIKVELPATPARGDAERVAQVITNLLTNAVHHNRDGGEIRLTTRSANGVAVLTVADNGPGIAPEHLPRIFDRFYRVDAARTASEGRSGLGLAISKAIVEAHGGMIEATSEPGVGATFTVRLPVGS